MSIIEPLSDEIISEKQSILKEVLISLSKKTIKEDDPIFDKCAEKLVLVYSEDYRQFYSELYPIILEISDGDISNIDALLFNVESLRIRVKEDYDNEKKFPPYLYGKLIKLSDHLTLEYLRYVYSLEMERKIDDSSLKSEDLKKEIGAFSKRGDELAKDLKKARKKVSGMQTEMVLMLSIFAIIVMAFSGGLTILGGSLAGMASVSPFKIAFVILLCGIVLFNTIAYLMYAINKIVDNSENDNDIDDFSTGASWGIKSLLKMRKFKHGYVIAFNALLLILVLMDVCLWYIY